MTQPSLLDEQIDGYLVHLRTERNLSDHTLAAYGSDLAHFSRFVVERGVEDARAVEPSLVSEWTQDLAEAGRKSSSQARMLVAVRGFYRFLRAQGEIEGLPTETVDLPKQARRLPHGVLGRDALRLLELTQVPRDAAFVGLLYGAGLRVSEVVNLELSDLHLASGFVTVMGKGRKERVVPLGPVVAERVETYLQVDRARYFSGTSEAVFPGRGRTGRVTRQTVFLRLRRLALAAGLERAISPHDLRHGFATDLVSGGADLRSVQAMLGHADLRTTEIYTHVGDQHLKKVLKRSHPRR